MKIIIIAAISQNNVIGKNGIIPWNSLEEIKHFKATTIGFPVIMGRKTWESLNQPLIGRVNIVLTNQRNYQLNEGAYLFQSLKDSLTHCEKESVEKCFIIGGAKVYNEAIKYADEIILSVMKFEVIGDAHFPELDYSTWQEKTRTEFEEFSSHVYIRKDKNSRELIG